MLFEPDMESSMGAVATSLGNIGPGLGIVGPAENFATYSSYWEMVSFIFNAFGTT